MACWPPNPLPDVKTARLYLPDETEVILFDAAATFQCLPGHKFLGDPSKTKYEITCKEGPTDAEESYEPAVNYDDNVCVQSQ